MAQRSRRRKKTSQPDRRLIVLGAVGVIAVVVALLIAARDSSATGQPDSGAQPAPVFSLAGLDGDLSLVDFRGQYVLLNFWASWCPPCMREMPDLAAYDRAHRADAFTLLAVNVQEDRATVVAFLRTNGFDFPVALDETGAIYALYGGNGLPSSFLIGPDGSLVKVWPPGAITRAMLDRDVTPLLKG